MRRILPIVLVAGVLAVAAAVSFLRPASPTTATASAPPAIAPGQPTPTPLRTLFLYPGEREVHASVFRFAVPQPWAGASGAKLVNRSIVRQAWTASRDVEPPVPGASWATVPANDVVIELWEQTSPPDEEPAPDAALPISWAQAQRSTQDGFEVRRVRFRYALRPFSLVAHIGKDASAADRSAVDRALDSLIHDPIPDVGQYLDLFVVGALSDVPLAGVTHVDVGVPPAKFGMFVARGRQTVLAFWDEALQGWGPLRPCPIHYDDATKTFLCDRTGDRWSRVGAPVTLDDSFGLSLAPTVVIDGKILVKPSRITPVRGFDETAEFGGSLVAVPATRASRADIVQRAQALSPASSGEALAKLVAADEIARSHLLEGWQPAQAAWLAVTTGEIRLQGSNALLGRWSLLAFDENGKLLRAACCGPGDRPAGFDALTDLAR